jgi:hypothetical protein
MVYAVTTALLFLIAPFAISSSSEEEGSQRRRRRRGQDGDSCMILLVLTFFVIVFLILVVYAESWVVWSNFLHETPEELYCVESSTLVDLVYCLLPVVLGISEFGGY